MTNESVERTASSQDTTTSRLRFGMVVFNVKDLQRSVEFYRLLGLNVPDPRQDRPVVMHELGAGVTLILTTAAVATAFDAAWEPPGPGYRQVTEFFVDNDDAVDAAWTRMTSAGYREVSAPGRLNGPYATVIEDPDGNVNPPHQRGLRSPAPVHTPS